MTALQNAAQALRIAMPEVRNQSEAFASTARFLSTLDSSVRLAELEGWLAAECSVALDELTRCVKTTPRRKPSPEDAVRLESAAAKTAMAYRALSVLRHGLPTDEELQENAPSAVRSAN